MDFVEKESIAFEINYSPAMMLLNTPPIVGPKKYRMMITTTATNVRIKAYSTRPWPFWILKSSIPTTSFL
jgi:hypothetical protein